MTRDEFWELVRLAGEGSHHADMTAQRLGRLLLERSPEEIRSFELRLAELVNDAARVDLWGAAYLINGGCSDDGFLYFCYWLITRGKEVFEAAVEDPDSLAEHLRKREDTECEELMSVARDAFEDLTGEELVITYPSPTPLALEDFWDFDSKEELEARLPRLLQLRGW